MTAIRQERMEAGLAPRNVRMKLREEIQNLVELGRLPSEEDAGDEILRKI
jgi:hypothetical protein